MRNPTNLREETSARKGRGYNDKRDRSENLGVDLGVNLGANGLGFGKTGVKWLGGWVGAGKLPVYHARKRG